MIQNFYLLLFNLFNFFCYYFILICLKFLLFLSFTTSHSFIIDYFIAFIFNLFLFICLYNIYIVTAINVFFLFSFFINLYLSFNFSTHWGFSVFLPLQKRRFQVNYWILDTLVFYQRYLDVLRVFHQQFPDLSNFQSVFRANHSATSVFLKIIDNIRFAMDERLVTSFTLFD